MSQVQTTTSSSFEVCLDFPASSKFECERRAFMRLLPKLMATHPGQYVAIHNEGIADAGDDRLAVALRVLERVGNVDIYVGFVGDQQEPVSRSGVRRDLGARRTSP